MSLLATQLIGFGAKRASAAAEQTVTWNPSDKASNVSLTSSDRTAGASSAGFGAVRATLSRSSGKFYWEILLTVPSASSHSAGIGNGSFALTNYVGTNATSVGCNQVSTTNNGYTVVNGAAFTQPNGSYLMFAIDFALGYCWVGKDNAWQNSGNPSGGTNPWVSGVSGSTFPAVSVYETANSFTLRTKTSEISGTVPSGFSVWAAP